MRPLHSGIVTGDAPARDVVGDDLKLAQRAFDAVVGFGRERDGIARLEPFTFHIRRVHEHDVAAALNAAEAIVLVVDRRVELPIGTHRHQLVDAIVFRRDRKR